MNTKIEKQNRKSLTKYIKILQRLIEYIKESDSIGDPTTGVIWIKRIITFIENELPSTKKYHRIIALLEGFIAEGNELSTTLTATYRNVTNILFDLAKTYELNFNVELSIDLHPNVKEHSLELFNNGHYAQAVFESVKALNNYVKDKGKITDKDLAGAMAKSFDETNPIIKLNDLKTQSDIDEQKGFKFLFMGAMTGIRNPIGHENYELDKNTALEYLAFLSLLFRKAEDGKI